MEDIPATSLKSTSNDLHTDKSHLQDNITPSCGIKRGDSSALEEIPAHDRKRKQEAESEHMFADVVPFNYVTRLDDSSPSNTVTTAPCKPLRRKDKMTLHAGSTSPQTDSDSSCLKDTEQTSWTKSHETPAQASFHLILPFKNTKGTKILTSKPEPEKSNIEQTASLSIINKISLPQHGKKLFSRNSDQVDTDKGLTAQKAGINREPVQIRSVSGNTDKIGQVVVASEKSDMNIPSSNESEDAGDTAEGDTPPTHPIPRPRIRKRTSGSFPDDFLATDGTSQGSLKEETQSAKQAAPSSCSSTSTTLTSLGDHPFKVEEEMISVPLRRSRLTTDSSDRTLTPSHLPVPKPRAKKRLSDSFPGDVVISGSSPLIADNLHPESVHNNERAGSLVALPRAKKHLIATHSESTREAASHLEMEVSQRNPDEMTSGSTSLDSSVVSEVAFVSVQDKDDDTSQLEQEVLAAMQEEVLQPDSTETSEKALDEIIKGWTFTDEAAVKDQPEEISQLESEQASSQDDWLNVDDNKSSEPAEETLHKEMKDEDVDFEFVSVVVTAGCLEDQRSVHSVGVGAEHVSLAPFLLAVHCRN